MNRKFVQVIHYLDWTSVIKNGLTSCEMRIILFLYVYIESDKKEKGILGGHGCFTEIDSKKCSNSRIIESISIIYFC
jgi:hypothetical protein